MISDQVFARFWYGPRLWRRGLIVARAGLLSFDVQVGGDVHRRHAAQLFRDRGVPDSIDEDESQDAGMAHEGDVSQSHDRAEPPAARDSRTTSYAKGARTCRAQD